MAQGFGILVGQQLGKLVASVDRQYRGDGIQFFSALLESFGLGLDRAWSVHLRSGIANFHAVTRRQQSSMISDTKICGVESITSDNHSPSGDQWPIQV
jgi:hypothetical protein